MTGAWVGKWRPVVAVVAVIALLAAVIVGCGGDDPTTATGASNAGTGAGDGQSSPPNAEFVRPGGDNSVQRSGVEAPPAERTAASVVLAAYLRAGATERRAAQCRQLSAAALESLQQLGNSCANALEAVTPDEARSASAMVGPIGSLRVEDDRAYALYHGRGGVDYAIAMRREGGEWKVDSLAPVELP